MIPRSGKYTRSALVSPTCRSPCGPGTLSSTGADLVATRGTLPATLDDVPERPEPDPQDRPRLFDDELVGLDPDDPEARAFAAHLDRMQRHRPSFTVEGYLAGVTDFADSANRAQGGRRWAAVLVVLALLTVAGYQVWDALMFVLLTWL